MAVQIKLKTMRHFSFFFFTVILLKHHYSFISIIISPITICVRSVLTHLSTLTSSLRIFVLKAGAIFIHVQRVLAKQTWRSRSLSGSDHCQCSFGHGQDAVNTNGQREHSALNVDFSLQSSLPTDAVSSLHWLHAQIRKQVYPIVINSS